MFHILQVILTTSPDTEIRCLVLHSVLVSTAKIWIEKNLATLINLRIQN
jgi:hypothetical protein